MKKHILLFALTCSFTLFSQSDLKQLLKKNNQESVPYISVDSLLSIQNKVILLDSRELEEYKISHIPKAIYVGYDTFSIKKISHKIKNKNTSIVVYCSLGIRSEDIGEKLLNAGYTNVLNLYGGIFEWKNKNNIVVNHQEKITNKIHTFNKEWSQWLHKGEKIYD